MDITLLFGKWQEGVFMDQETAQVTKKYVQEVRKWYPDAKVYLFGSRARDDHWVTSDFDFLVVSKQFGGQSPSERTGALLKLWSYHRDADIICLTPEEFERQKKRSTLLKLALKDGMQLA